MGKIYFLEILRKLVVETVSILLVLFSLLSESHCGRLSLGQLRKKPSEIGSCRHQSNVSMPLSTPMNKRL